MASTTTGFTWSTIKKRKNKMSNLGGDHTHDHTHTYLQEAADDLLVFGGHGDNVLEEPEEGPVLTRSWLHVGQDAKKLKEQLSSPT